MSANYGAGNPGNALVWPSSSKPTALPSAITLYGPDGRALTTSDFQSPIDVGPGVPFAPRITVPFAPREYQYPPGWNLISTPRGEGAGLRFAQLRALAAALPDARVCINYLKKEVRSSSWEVVPKESKSPKAREKHSAEIERVRAFWRKPNRVGDLRFGPWAAQLVEEILTIDAGVFYRYPTKDGGLHSLVQIDGATIKPLIDQYGYVVGYQQILYGYPSTEYSALKSSTTLDDFEPGDISYIVLNPSVDSAYGTAPLEEIKPLVDIAIRRLLNHAAWYSDGNIPTVLLEAPDGWEQAQIAAFQIYLDDTFSGNDAQRHKLRLMPHGAKPVPLPEFRFNKEEDEAIKTALCAYFGVPASVFGVARMVTKAGGETANDQASDTGKRPLLEMIADFADDVNEEQLDAPNVEFAWLEGDSGNHKEKAETLAIYVTAGIKTVNEARAEEGLDPIENEEVAPGAGVPGAVTPGAGTLPPGAPAPSEPKAVAGETNPPSGEPKVAAGETVAKAAGTVYAIRSAHPTELTDAHGAPLSDADREYLRAQGQRLHATMLLDPQHELGAWRRFALKRVDRGRHSEAFETRVIPAREAQAVRDELVLQKDVAGVLGVFDRAADRLAKAAVAKPAHAALLTPAKKRNYEEQLEAHVAKKLLADKAAFVAYATPKLKPEEGGA